MKIDGFYVLISRVRTFGGLRLLQCDDEGLANVAKLQHDEYLYAWVRGYDRRGHWSETRAANALNEICKLRAAAKAKAAAVKAKAKADKAARATAARAMAARAKAPNQPLRSQAAVQPSQKADSKRKRGG